MRGNGWDALSVKLGVLVRGGYVWFTGLNHRVTEDEGMETTICWKRCYPFKCWYKRKLRVSAPLWLVIVAA